MFASRRIQPAPCAVSIRLIFLVSLALCVAPCPSCLSSAAVAAGQLRDGGGGEPAPLLPVQPLLASLPGAEAGPGQRGLLWQAHPLRLHGPEDAAPGHQVQTWETVRWTAKKRR